MTTNTSSVTSAARGGVGGTERKLTPDLARGFMLLLIAMAYAPLYLPEAGTSVNTHPAGGSPLDEVVRVLALLFLDNRSFPMFAALFGYGMAMLVARQLSAGTPDKEVRRLLRRRGFALLLFGAAHAMFIFPGEILGAYGLAGLVIGWLLMRSDKAIMIGAAVMVPVYALTVPIGGFAMAHEGGAGIVGYTTAMDWVERVLFWPVSPVFNLLFFPLLLALLLGAWAGKRGLLDRPQDHRKLLLATAVGGIAVSVLGALPAVLIEVGYWPVEGLEARGLVMGLHTLTGVAGGIGYAALFGVLSMRLERSPGVFTQALAVTGKNSLTAYLTASVLLAVVLHADLLGLGAHLHSAGAIGVAVLCWLAAVLFIVALDKKGKRGPADRALRAMVYRGR